MRAYLAQQFLEVLLCTGAGAGAGATDRCNKPKRRKQCSMAAATKVEMAVLVLLEAIFEMAVKNAEVAYTPTVEA